MRNQHLIRQLADNANTWLSYYENWVSEIRKARERVQESRSIIELIVLKDYNEIKGSLNINEVNEFLKLIWLNKSFGSVGQGQLSEEDVTYNRLEELYLVTQQMLRILRETKNPYLAYWESQKIMRSGRTLRAVKMRALAALSDLQVTCLFYDKFYYSVSRYFDLEGNYPDRFLQDTLATFLPEEYQNDPVAIYIFPWVVYSAVISKEEDWLLDGIDPNPSSILKEPESFIGVPKYGWLKSVEIFENKIPGKRGVLQINLLDTDLITNLNQFDIDHLFISDSTLSSTTVFELTLTFKKGVNNTISEIQYVIHEIYELNSPVVQILQNAGLQSARDIINANEVLTVISMADYIAFSSILDEARVGERIETSNNLYKKGNSYVHRDKEMDPKLGIEEIANKLGEQIGKLRDEEGQVVGIFGKWGRGKTFLIKHLCKKLGLDYYSDFQTYDSKRKYHLAKVHAWKYKEEHTFWAYLYEKIAEQYYMDSYWPKLNKPFRIAKLNLYRMGVAKSILLVLPLILSFIWWWLSLDCKAYLLGAILRIDISFKSITAIHKTILTITPFLISAYLFKKNVFPKASKLYTSISKKHSFKDVLGFQATVQDELRTLLKFWIKSFDDFSKQKRLLIVVDDLDRCDYKNIVPIADALRIILEDQEIIKRTIVITLVDESILAGAIRLKYSVIGNTSENQLREYMDKLFLTGIKLPDLLDDDKIAILDSITKDLIYESLEISNQQATETQFEDQEDTEEPEKPVTRTEYDSENTANRPSMTTEAEDHIPENFQITKKEKDLLDQYVIHLNNPTPRQIKIFYYRYLLIKLLDETEEFNLSKKMPHGHFNEFAIYSIVAAHLENLTQETVLPQELGYAHYNEIEESIRKRFKILVDMVVPY